MSGSLKEYLPTPVRQLGFNILSTIQKIKWKLNGKPIPPPNKVKQELVGQVAREKDIKTLVETGTYLGNMIFAQRKNFDKIYSVELSPVFYDKAVKRFKSHSHINILFGDSADMLPKIIQELDKPSLFWLDGHYSGGETAESNCPVLNELDAITNSSIVHEILIDDARCFDGTKGYPSLEEIGQLLSKKVKKHQIEVDLDIIRISYSL
tara:strand:+ start:92501 stop:93124 length:624 start_codon:yes stop_codon:yes gene_type:complete